MRILAPLFLALTMTPASAQTLTGIDWQLLAIDGVVIEAEATLRIEEDGTIGGQAPCNRWSAMNGASLPALDIKAIRATRMACEKLAEEQTFFDALTQMTAMAMESEGEVRLILTGPNGQSMEFVTERTDDPALCRTCLPKE